MAGVRDTYVPPPHPLPVLSVRGHVCRSQSRGSLRADERPNIDTPVISDAPFHVQSSGAHGDAAAHGSHPPAGAAEPPRRPRPAMQWGAGGAQAGNDAEGLLLKLPPGILLVLMWYVYLMHGTDLFSWFSTLSLVVLTLLYLSYALPGYAQGPVSLLDDALTGLFHYINPPPPGSHAHHEVSRPPSHFRARQRVRQCACLHKSKACARLRTYMRARSHQNVPLTLLTLSADFVAVTGVHWGDGTRGAAQRHHPLVCLALEFLADKEEGRRGGANAGP